VALRGGQDVELDAADEQRVGRLLGAEALQVAVTRGPLRLDDLRPGVRRGADVSDLALLHEVGERSERLLDVDLRVGAVHLVEVDVVGAQAPQRVLDLGHDPAARSSTLVGVLAHRDEELRGQDDVVAAASEGLADDLL
jgi:hypothetical protein